MSVRRKGSVPAARAAYVNANTKALSVASTTRMAEHPDARSRADPADTVFARLLDGIPVPPPPTPNPETTIAAWNEGVVMLQIEKRLEKEEDPQLTFEEMAALMSWRAARASLTRRVVREYLARFGPSTAAPPDHRFILYGFVNFFPMHTLAQAPPKIIALMCACVPAVGIDSADFHRALNWSLAAAAPEHRQA